MMGDGLELLPAVWGQGSCFLMLLNLAIIMGRAYISVCGKEPPGL
jgi:hypothetical protein